MRPIYAPELMLESEAADIAIRWQDFEADIATAFKYKRVVVEIRIRQREVLPLLDSPPTDCERDIVAFLTTRGRTKQPDVIAALTECHGESTITKALARMVRDGRITHVVKRGYDIPRSG